jgi:valyl-tRNA synthetase
VLEALLRLAHPIMPFISEEIWQRIGPLAGTGGETIMTQAYPEAEQTLVDADAEAELHWVMRFVLGIRRIKGEMNIAPSKPLPVLLQHASARDRSWLAGNRRYLDFLARLESVQVLAEGEAAPESATALVGEMKLLIPMAGLIDKAAELARLEKEIGRLGQDLERTEKKLANASFVDKAPTAVVAKEREKLGQLGPAIAKLKEQREKIRAL